MNASDPMKNNHAGRIENIQALRFVAAALVLLTHITFYASSRINSDFTIWQPGAAGVSLFFVISGIVIYLSSDGLPRDKAGSAEFMRRRVLRIFPLYWLVTTAKLAIVLIVPAALVKNQASVAYVIASYLLVPFANAEGRIEPLHGVGWSLIHEMFFYYVFAAALFLRRSPFVVSSIVIGSLCLVGLFVDEQNPIARVCLSEQNMLFVVGMVLAHLHRKGWGLRQPMALAAVIVGAALMLTESGRALWYPVLRRFDLGAVLILLGALSLRVPAGRLFNAAVKLGNSSYSLYLFHPIIAPAILLSLWKVGLVPLPLAVLLTFGLCIALGHLALKWVESPLNRATKSLLRKR